MAPDTFADLLEALSAPACALERFQAGTGDGGFTVPAGTAPSDLFCARVVDSLKDTLTHVRCEGTGLAGDFPESLCACTELTFLGVYNEPGVTGQLSRQIGRLTNLEELYTWKDTSMSGPVPAEFGNLAQLKTMQAHNHKDISFTKGTWRVSAMAAKDGKRSTYTSFADAFANYKPA